MRPVLKTHNNNYFAKESKQKQKCIERVAATHSTYIAMQLESNKSLAYSNFVTSGEITWVKKQWIREQVTHVKFPDSNKYTHNHSRVVYETEVSVFVEHLYVDWGEENTEREWALDTENYRKLRSTLVNHDGSLTCKCYIGALQSIHFSFRKQACSDSHNVHSTARGEESWPVARNVLLVGINNHLVRLWEQAARERHRDVNYMYFCLPSFQCKV